MPTPRQTNSPRAKPKTRSRQRTRPSHPRAWIVLRAEGSQICVRNAVHRRNMGSRGVFPAASESLDGLGERIVRCRRVRARRKDFRVPASGTLCTKSGHFPHTARTNWYVCRRFAMSNPIDAQAKARIARGGAARVARSGNRAVRMLRQQLRAASPLSRAGGREFLHVPWRTGAIRRNKRRHGSRLRPDGSATAAR